MWTRFFTFILFTGLAAPAAALDIDYKQLYRETGMAVVLIKAFDPGGRSYSLGTGSIIRNDGLVLTNAHVIFNDETGRPFTQIRIFFKPEHVTGDRKIDLKKRSKANVIGYSDPLDLAIVQIHGRPSSLPHLKFADSDRIEIGESVLAIGHPEQGGLWTLTKGTISTRIKNFENIPGKDVFQTDASINRGNSGGPLLDQHGLMVAINSNIARRSEDGLAITGINFSIKSNIALKWLKSTGNSFTATIPSGSTQQAGFIPLPKSKEPEPGPLVKEPTVKEPEGPQILTEIRPYSEEELFQQVEEEMEDLMQDMKKRLRNR